MRIVCTVHFSMPWRNAGSEVVLHELMKHLVAQGHSVTVYCTNRDATRSWTGREPHETVDGVQIIRCKNIIMAARAAAQTKPDVWVSHHQHVLHSIRCARQMNARSVFLVHNNFDINQRPMALKPDLVVFNTHWVKASLISKFGAPTQDLVFWPPLTPERHLVDRTGDAVTLVNLNRDKGALIFYALAERMPHQQFLGVVGGHGEQIIRRNHPNVTIMEHDPDMKRIWEKTKVLLMPSVQESYGLVVGEAGLNGIPTLANATPGLQENVGEGGNLVWWSTDKFGPFDGNEALWNTEWATPSAEHVDVWEKKLGGILDDSTYKGASAYASNRADEAMAATRQTLNQWGQWVTGAITKPRTSV